MPRARRLVGPPAPGTWTTRARMPSPGWGGCYDGAMNEGERRRVIPPEADHVPKGRMLALTDGVMAIAMTLLVLDIKLPEELSGAALRQALGEAQSQTSAFLLSAVVIALFWRAHHVALRNAGALDPPLFWLNVAFLVLVSLI